MKAFVTGAAGFIGSHLVDRLLYLGHDVVGYDNFSTGSFRNIKEARRHKRFCLEHGDLCSISSLQRSMSGADIAFHLAAHADVRSGPAFPKADLLQNTIGTSNVLEAMRYCGVNHIVFTSTGSVYGEPRNFPTPEDASFPTQTSLYGASKLAGEALITAYCEAFDMQCWMLRLVSNLGERYSHGHVADFVSQLMQHPDRLDVLGDGNQRKSYIYVHDCVEGMLHALEHGKDRVNIYNLGTDDYCTVTHSARVITDTMGVSPKVSFAGGERGWVGDSPYIYLDCSKLKRLGWKATTTIDTAIRRTVGYLLDHKELLNV